MKLSDIGAKNDMYRGWRLEKPSNKVIYEMWKHLLIRTHCDPSNSHYEYYKDCTCHPDFLLLSNFVKWIEKEPNYQLLLENPGSHKWSIDKDGIIPGNKEYAPGKIRLVTTSDNVKERNKRRGNPCIYQTKAVISIEITTNTIKYFDSIAQTRDFGFNDSSVSKCVRKLKYRETHKNHKWFYADDILSILNYFYNL